MVPLVLIEPCKKKHISEAHLEVCVMVRLLNQRHMCDIRCMRCHQMSAILADCLPFWGKEQGKWGLNSGAVMMHLGRMRAANFSETRDALIDEFGPSGRLRLGDQDILNIYGGRHPEGIYEMSCIYNFRHDINCSDG